MEAHESTRKGLESTLPKYHEDHIVEKGLNSISHYNLVCKFVPMPQAMKIPDAKAAMDKDMGKTRETASAAIIQSNEQKRSRSGSTKKENVSPFATLMDICHIKNAELEPKYQKYRGRVVLRGNIVELSCVFFTSMTLSYSPYAVFTDSTDLRGFVCEEA